MDLRGWYGRIGRIGAGPHSLIARCLVAAGAVAVAFVTRESLRPVLGNSSPFLLFTPAVAVAAYYGGTIPGAGSTIVCAYLGRHFFLTSQGEPALERWDRVALFLLVGALITGLDAVSRASRSRLNLSLRRERAARADAEEANQAKDRFLAVVSHELQTPISVVLGWAHTIRRRSLDEGDLERALVAIERNAVLQSRLVADLLDVSRIATGRLRLHPQELSLRAVVQAAVDQVDTLLSARGIHFSVLLPEDQCSMVGDGMRLQQVFANLLGNAAKFTPAEGHVTLRLTCGPSEAVITVSDTGVGIRRDFLPLVFERFQQDTETVSRSVGGLGLGLSIVRYCVDAHGGTVRADSDGPGLGARFTVRLPRSAPILSAGLPRPDMHQSAEQIH